MFVRVVRFTDVDAERLESMVGRVSEADGPPAGVPAMGIKVVHDESQGTAVVLQFFETAEKMKAGGEALSAMDASDTPGTRASVDGGELKLEREMTGSES